MDGCVYYRNYLPSLYLTATGNHKCRLDNKFIGKQETNKETQQIDTYWDVSFIANVDILVFSRYYPITDYPMVKTFIAAAKHFNKKIVYETDDDLFNIPLDNGAYIEATEARNLVLYMMENADAYTVTTKRLGELLTSIRSKPTYVLPNSLEVESIRDQVHKKLIKPKKKDVFRIGWSGGSSHIADMAQITPALKKFMRAHKNVEFVIFGAESVVSMMPFKVTHVPFCSVDIYQSVLEDLDLDLAICPLLFNNFNKHKSPIKWEEYSLCRYPVMASNVPPYSDAIEDGETGMLVNNVKNDWLLGLEKLYNSKELRDKLSNNGFNKVYNDYDIGKNFLLWEEAYKRILNAGNS